MAELQVAESGTFEAMSPAAVLATALATRRCGRLVFHSAHTRHTLSLTRGAFASADGPVPAALAAALALESGGFEFSAETSTGGMGHEPWRALQAATLHLLGKDRLNLLARRLRRTRLERTGSNLEPWALGIPDAARTLRLATDRLFSEVIRTQPQIRSLINLALLGELGLIRWTGDTGGVGTRPFVWRGGEEACATAAGHEVIELRNADDSQADEPVAGEPVGDEPTATAAAQADACESEFLIIDTEESPDEPARDAPPAADEPIIGVPAYVSPITEVGSLLAGSAFDEGLMFLRDGFFGAAKYRFEDHLKFHPGDLEAAAYVTFIDLHTDLRDEAARGAALKALDLALSRRRTADLLTFKGSVLRLDRRFNEALICLDEALHLEPRHPNARYERKQVRLRLGSDEWPDVNVEDVRVDAAIIVQRRIGGQARIYSFTQHEIRIGSSDNDDVVVSDAVLPQVARRHCTVLSHDHRIWVRRNASLGQVFVNGREIDIRKEVPLRPKDTVRLGDGAFNLEFRAFGLSYLHKMSVLATGGIR